LPCYSGGHCLFFRPLTDRISAAFFLSGRGGKKKALPFFLPTLFCVRLGQRSFLFLSSNSYVPFFFSSRELRNGFPLHFLDRRSRARGSYAGGTFFFLLLEGSRPPFFDRLPCFKANHGPGCIETFHHCIPLFFSLSPIGNGAVPEIFPFFLLLMRFRAFYFLPYWA